MGGPNPPQLLAHLGSTRSLSWMLLPPGSPSNLWSSVAPLLCTPHTSSVTDSILATRLPPPRMEAPGGQGPGVSWNSECPRSRREPGAG